MQAGCGTSLSDGRYASVIQDDDGVTRLVVVSANREIAFVVVIPAFTSGDYDELARALNTLDARFTLASELED